MRSRKLGVGSVLALVGVAALAGGALSLALRDGGSQAGAVSPSASTSTSTDRYHPYPERGMRFFRRPSARQILERRRRFQAALAKELGVSADRVAKAFRTLFQRRLDRAVANKRLTRRQADRLLQCYDSGKCGRIFKRKHRFRDGHPGPLRDEPPGPPPGDGAGIGPPGYGPPM